MHGIDGDGAYLSQVGTVEMKRAASNDLAMIFENNEIAHIFAKVGKRSGQQSSVPRIGGNQFVDSFRIWKNGFTRSHELPPESMRFSSSHLQLHVSPALAPCLPGHREAQAPIEGSGRSKNPVQMPDLIRAVRREISLVAHNASQ